MNANELNEFFHMAIVPSSVSTEEVFKPEPTEAQKWRIWQELKAQEEMFKNEIFNTWKD